ncbi:hypothetical protein SCHPADRAFT_822250 [Schizopora paradoxa]|uniref:Dihydrofolate reductase n=1 Tax=Schizopora paradoxa TaxID=27342 RepID=A0A0H2SIV5_9AGAM|nr:hypothetical protein SCHPADRAFT_822250 [Schizopora paradoxa]
MSSSITVIVAATLTNGIGKNGNLPWRLPKEMKYFQHVTTNAPEGSINAVIMGRNTWESIPERFRPLPNRLNLIVTRNEQYLDDFRGAADHKMTPKPSVHASLKDAILHVLTAPLASSSDIPDIHRTFIIGGAAMYREALGLTDALPNPNADDPSTPSTGNNATRQKPLADRILLTRILSPAFEDCDVRMPEFRDEEEEEWTKASREDLVKWVGQNVPENPQEENKMKPGEVVKYEFEMWTRRQ